MKFSLFLFFTGEILHKCYSYDDKGGAATSNDSAHHRAFQREKLIEYVFGEEGQHPLMKKIALEHNENDFEKRAVETINNIRSSGCSCIDCQRSIITYETNWSDSFNEQGWSYAVKGFMTGLYRNNKGLYRSGYAGWDNDHIFRLEEVESKDAPSQYSTFVDCYNANWWDSFDINNSWSKCKTGYYMTGLYRSGSMNSDYYGQSLHNIEESRCCRPVNAKEEWGQCYEQSVSFVNKGWSKCKDGYYMAGMYRGNGDFLHNIQTFFCCKMGPLSSKPKCCSKPTHHPTPIPTHHPTPKPTHHPTPIPSRPPTPKPTHHPTPKPTLQTQAPVQACSGIVKPGGDVRTLFSVQMGRTSGWFHMSYEFYTVKDRIQVSYEGKTLYDTKTFISGCHRSIKISYGPGTSTKVDILVTSQSSGTAWKVATSCPYSTSLPNVCS